MASSSSRHSGCGRCPQGLPSITTSAPSHVPPPCVCCCVQQTMRPLSMAALDCASPLRPLANGAHHACPAPTPCSAVPAYDAGAAGGPPRLQLGSLAGRQGLRLHDSGAAQAVPAPQSGVLLTRAPSPPATALLPFLCSLLPAAQLSPLPLLLPLLLVSTATPRPHSTASLPATPLPLSCTPLQSRNPPALLLLCGACQRGHAWLPANTAVWLTPCNLILGLASVRRYVVCCRWGPSCRDAC